MPNVWSSSRAVDGSRICFGTDLWYLVGVLGVSIQSGIVEDGVLGGQSDQVPSVEAFSNFNQRSNDREGTDSIKKHKAI
jgi:hypothetical protein